MLSKVGRAGRVVLHDPAVKREGKTLVGLLLVRTLLALGASAELVHVVAAAAGVHIAGV